MANEVRMVWFAIEGWIFWVEKEKFLFLSLNAFSISHVHWEKSDERQKKQISGEYGLWTNDCVYSVAVRLKTLYEWRIEAFMVSLGWSVKSGQS